MVHEISKVKDMGQEYQLGDIKYVYTKYGMWNVNVSLG